MPKLINYESAKTAQYRIRNIMKKRGVTEEEARAIHAAQRKREVVPSKKTTGRSRKRGKAQTGKLKEHAPAGGKYVVICQGGSPGLGRGS